MWYLYETKNNEVTTVHSTTRVVLFATTILLVTACSDGYSLRQRMILRSATTEDAFDIAEVHVASWRHAFKGIMSQDLLDNLSVPERANSWHQILNEDQGKVFVSEHGGSISGIIHAREYRYDDIAEPLPGEVTSIYLSPEVTGQGVGASLLKRGIAFLEAQGSLILLTGFWRRILSNQMLQPI